MTKTYAICLSSSILALGAAMPATAAILSADFRVELDLPDQSSAGPRVFESLGVALNVGDELTLADEVANPAGWGGAVTLDLSASGILTISDVLSEGAGDYDLAIITVSNIVFDGMDAVSSVTELTMDLFDPSFPAAPPSTTIGFGDDFVSITFDETGGGQVADFEFLDGGSASYQFGISDAPDVAAVPLPASLPLLLAGLGGAAVLRGRKR